MSSVQQPPPTRAFMYHLTAAALLAPGCRRILQGLEELKDTAVDHLPAVDHLVKSMSGSTIVHHQVSYITVKGRGSSSFYGTLEPKLKKINLGVCILPLYYYEQFFPMQKIMQQYVCETIQYIHSIMNELWFIW